MSKLNVLLTTLLIAFLFTSLQAGTIVGIADNAFVLKNNTLVFDVLENDKIDGEVLGFGIEIHPTYGKVIINDDKSVTYKPDENVCEEQDYFFYYLEDEDGPKLVEVTIDILCEPLTIMSGFSVEDETKTDEKIEGPTAFTIIGVENFPDNSLYVFSDAGKEVYYTQGYTNEWNGKNKQSTEMETDRIYYYVFNDGLGKTYCGYVQMN